MQTRQFQTLYPQALFTLLAALLFVFIFPAAVTLGTGLGALAAIVLAISVVWASGIAKTLTAQDLFPWLALFAASFVVTLGFSLSWPDFIPMGERLRDYALIGSVLTDPVHPKEPWLPMVGINYYVYWYRFAFLLHVLFGLSPAAVYHTLVSCIPAFLVTASALALFYGARWKLLPSALGGVLIAFGSNLFGIGWFLKNDQNWWAPSRVVKGAINEFPMWSYVLGDAHPHFLNYAAPTALFLLLTAAVVPSRTWIAFLTRFTIGFVLILLFIAGANAWEMPVILLQGATLLLLLSWRLRVLRRLPSSLNVEGSLELQKAPGSSALNLNPFDLKHSLALGAALLILAACLVCAAGTVSPQHTKVGVITDHQLGLGSFFASVRLALGIPYTSDGNTPWVQNVIVSILQTLGLQAGVTDTPVTPLRELMKHWGIPFILIVSSLVLTPIKNRVAVVLSVCLIVAALANSSLIAVAAILGCLITDELHRFGERLATPQSLTILALGCGGLLAVGLCEVFFVDDPYGGESERLNTIFKFYASAWTGIHLLAFLRVTEGFRRLWSYQSKRGELLVAGFLLGSLWLGCFAKSSALRAGGFENLRERASGLATAERDYQGADAVISFLRKMPRAIVAEAEGNPYSMFGFVSTLGDQWTYLGWVNHVQLLYPDHGEEINRRKEKLDFIYNRATCEEIRSTLVSENISLLVVGPLEKQRYPAASDAARFNCLRPVKAAGQLRLVAP